MSALSAARNTPQMAGDVLSFPVDAATTIHQGGLVMLDGGYAVPGAAATGLVAAGRAESTVSAVSLGDTSVPVRRGIFRFANSTSADLIAQDDVGADCYVVDDQTVALTNGTNTRSRAGVIVAVDDSGVWVQVGLGL